MKLIWWMLSGSLVSSIVLATVLGADIRLEIWLGMLGPLVSAVVSWIAMERQHARGPSGMTTLMIKAFAAKMIFFAGYITALLSMGCVRPIPFVISFIGYYLSLHAMEAIGLRRLQAGNPPLPPDALQGQLRNG
jgi:hypothetical protein